MSTDSFNDYDPAAGRQRLWGVAVLVAIAVIVLPMLLDGAGSESKFRRVEELRAEPPIVVDELGNTTKLGLPDEPAKTNSDSVALSGDDLPSDRAVAEPRPANEASDQPSDQLADQPSDQLADQLADVSGIVDNFGEQSNAGVASGSATDQAERVLQENLPRNSADMLTAWVVQAAAFRQEPAAIVIRDQLRLAGFASFVQDRDNPDDLFRVLVGPMIKEQRAIEARDKVADLLGSDAVVTSYP